MAVATQEVFSHTGSQVEIWDIGAAAPARTLVKRGSRFGVTLTNTSDVTGNVGSKTYGNVTVTVAKTGGVGNDKATAIDATQAAPVAVDGTWEFEGIVSSGTTPVPTSTPQGTPVYATNSGGDLTLDSTSATKVGEVNYPATYTKVAGTLPIKIGV
jgi:hypothetical protein